MSANVPTGSVITYKGEWHTGWFTGYNDLINQVGAQLLNDGLKITRVVDASVKGVIGSVDSYLGGPATAAVTIEVTVTGGSGYNSGDDVGAIINHEVYQVTGTLPGVSSVTGVAVPAPGSTGGAAGSGAKVTQLCGSGIVETIKGWFGLCTQPNQPPKPSGGFSLSSLTSSGVLYIGLAIFGFVAALALIGYSGALRRPAA